MLAALAFAACASGGPSAVAPVAPAPSPVVREASPLPSPSPTATPLVTLPGTVALSAPSADVVWALANGAFLFESSDRGVTWSQRSLPGPRATGVSFISPSEGWLYLADADAHSLTIWRTADAGASWETARTISDFGPGEAVSGVTLVDSRHGFLATRVGQAPPTIFRTADGGVTWSRSAPVPITKSADFPVGHVLAAGGELLTSVGPEVFRSRDGGATWSFAGTSGDGTPIGALATAVHWVTWPGRVATDDGGGTWHPWATSYQQAAGVTPTVVFGGAAVVYASVRGTLQRSDDDGATWLAVRTPGT